MKSRQLFPVLLIIYFYSAAMAQTTYFIKYKETVPKFEIEQKVTSDQFIPPNVDFQVHAAVSSVDHLAKGLAKDDEVLGRVIKITFLNNVDESQFLQLKNLDPTIEYIQRANVYQMDLVPNDSLLSQQWALEKIRAFDAWVVTTGSDTVLLAIIDTGIEFFHPDLKNKIYYNPGEAGEKSNNGIDDDGNGFIDDYMGWDFVDRVGFPFDPSGGDELDWDNYPFDSIPGNFGFHGTFVAGIAGAEINNISGIAGVAPNIKLLNLRSFTKDGLGEEDDAAAAILYAVQSGAKVVNMSWGDYSFSYVLRDVVRYAYSKNVVLVGSSGNSGSPDPHYPSAYLEVISVGNSTDQDYVAGNSNWGSTLDLVAPGTEILSTDLDGGYRGSGGTSASAPFVSATAALILSLQNFTNEEVKQIIKSTTDDIDVPGWDVKSGAGRLNLYKAVTTLAPSIIKFNHPYQDFASMEDELTINASVLSASFSSYSLHYGSGLNPEDWTTLIQNSAQQFSNEDIYTLNLSSLGDNVYCLRLVVNLTNGRTLEERVNFHIIRTPPGVIEVANGPLYYGDKSTIGGEFYTDQVSVMRMYYRKYGETNFNYVTLDGFNTNNQFVKQLHYGFIPKEIVQPGTLYEVYFEAENLVGLITTVVDTLNNLNYFQFVTDEPPSISSYNQMAFTLPKGSLYPSRVSFLSENYDEVLFQTFYETQDLIYALFKYQNDEFIKIDSIAGKFPHQFGDFNNNGLKDLTSTSRQNIYIDEQFEAGSFDSLVTKYTDINSNNPIIVEDLDLDGNYEIVTLSDGRTLIKWDIGSNLTLLNSDSFYSYTDTSDTEPGYEFSNYPTTNMGVADVNNDGKKEIWFLDADGDLKSYVIESTGSPNKGNSFITSGLTTSNQNIFSIGDYDGDGVKDFAVLYQTNSIAPTFLLLVLSYINNQFDVITQKVFLDQSAEFRGFGFSEAYQSLGFADVDNDGVDELILNIFPYAYILKYDFLGDKFIYFTDGVNTEYVFAEDLNGNGMVDVAFQFSDGYKFLEFGPATRPEIPTILSAYSNASLQAELNWIYRTDQYYIYKGTSAENLELYDSVYAVNSYQDFNVEELTTYYYAIRAYDLSKPDPLSKLSAPVEVYIHKPAMIDSVYGTARSVIVKFSEKMKNTVENLQAFELLGLSDVFPNSISPANQYSYLVSFRENIPSGSNQIAISGLRDLYGSPIAADTIDFIMPEIITNVEFFVSSFEILDPYNIKITFNLEVDEQSATQTSNYVFDPENKATSVSVNQNDKKIIRINLDGQKPVGSIGREYVLRIKDIFSSPSSGSIPINNGAGSYIVLTSYAKDLSDVYVYPNPVEMGKGQEQLTFANLPKRAKITIFTISGTQVGEVEENDGNGGVSFNLKDNNGEGLASGIYFYRIVMLDDSDNEQDEKLGKFAVIR